MNENLRNKIEEVIDKYNLKYTNRYNEEEELAPSNVEYDLIDELLDTISDEVAWFIVKDD